MKKTKNLTKFLMIHTILRSYSFYLNCKEPSHSKHRNKYDDHFIKLVKGYLSNDIKLVSSTYGFVLTRLNPRLLFH